MPTVNQRVLEDRLDEILERLDRSVTLKCPVCDSFVHFKHTLRLSAGVTSIICPGCQGYFSVEVKKIDEST